MRKTRLVILPTKCLHQMGFLLLFLSCPVIGDWGRIRPESEDSHNAIQIDREGSCGLERDPPGGLLGFLNEDGSKQCRLSENYESTKVIEKAINKRSDVRQVDVRRFNQRMSQRRMNDERNVRLTIQRKTDESRDIRREFQTGVRRNVRSRSVESRQSFSSRNDMRIRSLSLSRVKNERDAREQRFAARNTRLHIERNSRDLVRRMSERQNEQRLVRQRRLNREVTNEKRENERATRIASERTENERASRTIPERRECKRLSRSAERERQEFSQESNRRLIQEVKTRRRENDTTRRQGQKGSERRLFLARRKVDSRRIDRIENRRSARREYTPETQKTRSLEFTRNKTDRRETSRFDNRRVTENRRSISLLPKQSERNTRDHRIDTSNERVEVKPGRVTAAAERRNQHDLPEPKLGNKNPEDVEFFGGITKWMDLKTYEGVKTENWTTNCVIGAVVYFLTTRQIKTV